MKRNIFLVVHVYQNKSVFFKFCEQVLLYFGSVAMHGHIASFKSDISLVSSTRTYGGLVSAGCSQRDDLSSNSVLNFKFLHFLIYTYFSTVPTVEPTEYIE